MSLEDRIRRLERQMARLDVPGFEEVSAAFGRLAAGVRARFRGEPEPFPEKCEEDRDTISRWAEAEGVDLETEAERARQKLMSVAPSQH